MQVAHGTIEKRYPPKAGRPADDYLVVTGSHGRTLLEHRIGSHEVSIRSTEVGWGTSPVIGPENLKRMRDALTEICKEIGIK